MQKTQEIRVQTLGWEDPLEEEISTHSWKLPQTEEPTVHGVAKSQTHTTERLSTQTYTQNWLQ